LNLQRLFLRTSTVFNDEHGRPPVRMASQETDEHYSSLGPTGGWMMSPRVTMGQIRIPSVYRGADVVFALQETAGAR
jgi:hypothetical protein